MRVMVTFMLESVDDSAASDQAGAAKAVSEVIWGYISLRRRHCEPGQRHIDSPSTGYHTVI